MDRTIHLESSAKEDQTMGERQKATVRDYIQVTKPGIVRANVLGAFAGYMLAAGGFPLEGEQVINLIWTLLGTALVIAGSATLNNIYDQDIDQYMERTRNRPVVHHRISPRSGILYSILLTFSGEVMLSALVNPLAAIMAFIGFLVYVLVYTVWMKRTTTLNTVIGGISGAMPPVVGYVAETGAFDMIAWILFVFMFLWQPPHFLALAMRRMEEYRRVGVPMLPVVAGFGMTKRQIFWYTLAMVPASLLLYLYEAVGILYLVAASVLGFLYLYHAVRGLFVKREQEIAWANFMFRYSILYLTAIFLLMMADAR